MSIEKEVHDMKVRVWLSFDLGVQGDYEGLYRWLDGRKAVECGDSMTSFMAESDADLPGKIKESLEAQVAFSKKARLYLIYKKKDQGYSGKFIIGGRKASPWQGFAEASSAEEDE